MDQRKRLIELIKHCTSCEECRDEDIADHLLANGVVAIDLGVVSPANRPLISQCLGNPLDEIIDLIRAKEDGRILPCKICQPMKEQIEKIAHLMCRNHMSNGKCAADDDFCGLECVYGYCAERVYNAGYRKQSEGEWLIPATGEPWRKEYFGMCSLCNKVSQIVRKYCPHCGAKMKGGAE